MQPSNAPSPTSSSSDPNASLTNWLGVAIATCAGVGTIPLAPGTFGSLVGVLLFFPLANLGVFLYSAAVLAVCGVGVWASDRAEVVFSQKDDGRIVIDELAGQLIALAPLVWLAGMRGSGTSALTESAAPAVSESVFFSLVVTGFVAFRVFDITKPGAVGWAEKSFSGGVGVMADDCVAGVFGAALLAAPIAIILW